MKRPLQLSIPILLALAAMPAHASASTLEARLRQTVLRLSQMESRVTGYPGCEAAADFLASELRALGISEIHEHRFTLPVPVDEGFHLEAENETIRLHGMWPNLVRTPTLPPAGIEGALIDAGEGDLDRLAGREIAGRIVLLDYNSEDRWVDMFHLGARAVIFLEQQGGHRKEGELKFLDVPANLPRLYAAAADTARLRRLAARQAGVRLAGRMPWQSVAARTLVGIVEGAHPQLKREAVYLQAYYDAMSPAPAVAPGAEQACSAAGLLELARKIAADPPARTAVLVFSPGHFQNLAGMRAFVPLLLAASDRRFQDRDRTDGEQALVRRLRQYAVRLFIGLDLSSGSDIPGAFKPAAPYRLPLLAPPIADRLLEYAKTYEDSVLSGRRLLANGLRQDLSRQRLGDLPQTIPFDASVAALAGCPALAFCTANDARARVDSPVDLPGRVDIERLGRQVALLAHLVSRLAEDPGLEPWTWGKDAFGAVRGEAVHYGPRSYLPDRPTAGALVRVRLRNPTLSGVRPDFWAVADDSGRFEIPGVAARIIYTQPVRVEAYGTDSAGGAVTDAPDWGINGERRLPGRALRVLMDDLEEEAQAVTFSGAGLTLFETFDPRNLLTPEQVELLDAATEAEPPSFGACLPLTPPEVELFGYRNRVGSWVQPVAVAFARPGTRAKIAMSTGVYGLGRRLLLLNADASSAEGTGYAVEPGARLTETAYRVGRDLTRLNRMRMDNLQRRGVRNSRLAAFQAKAEALLREAERANAARQHRAFLDRARRAWAYAAAAYRDISGTQAGVIQGALFLLAALIPFAHFAERLIFGFADLRRQVLGYFGLFGAGFLALRHLHPAFELSISPAIILLGFVILALALLVTALGVSRLNRELKALAGGRRARGRAGLHRAGAALTSISVGLAHMRRRPLRTGLTCGTLVLLTFSVLSFTSIRSSLRTNRVDIGGGARYEGALVRRPGWQTLERSAYRALADRYGPERTAPRVWLAVSSHAASFRVERADDPARAVGIPGISGLSAQEAGLVGPQQGLVAGRWLAPGEADACLLPAGVADSLGIGPADVERVCVRIFGETFRVAGLLHPDALDVTDLNGGPLAPLDPEAQQPAEEDAGRARGGKVPVFTHLQGAQVAVLPWQAVLRWEGARLVSTGVRFERPEPELQDLSETLDLDLFAGIGGRRYLVNTVGVASVLGVGDLAVPIGIAALIVLNTMLGAVYERAREIGTFNAVGLAPGHVSGLFMAEACAYAVVGGMLGYLLGQAAAQALGRWGLMPSLELNYSSLSAVFTLGLVMGVVALSALYPARMAARVCTPGIERRWQPPEPDGDRLRMRLPFTLARQDALGMVAFLAEFWEAHSEQSIGAGFYAENIRVRREGDRLRLEGRVWLAPFDGGVVQGVSLILAPEPGGNYYEIEALLDRTSGDYETWRRVSRTFLDDLRKQFLVWRTLSDGDREFYLEELKRWEAAVA